MDSEHPLVKKLQKELNAGSVALVLLTILEREQEPLYGYQIAKHLEHADESMTAGKQSSLYPVLRNMSENSLLDSWVEPSVSGPPRRYYRITSEGRLVLTEWKRVWERSKRFVDSVLADSDRSGQQERATNSTVSGLQDNVSVLDDVATHIDQEQNNE